MSQTDPSPPEYMYDTPEDGASVPCAVAGQVSSSANRVQATSATTVRVTTHIEEQQAAV